MISAYGILSHLFFGFGLYNLLFLLLKITSFGRKKEYTEFDSAAVRTLIFLGLTYLVLYIFDTILLFTDSDPTNKTAYLQRLNGPYGFSLFAQQFLYIFCSLAFLIPHVKRLFILRLFFGAGLLLNFEKIVIFTTTFHRDYLPSSWTMYSTLTGSIILDWQLSIALFICLSLLPYYYRLRKQSAADM